MQMVIRDPNLTWLTLLKSSRLAKRYQDGGAIFQDSRQLNVPKSYFPRCVMYLTDFDCLGMTWLVSVILISNFQLAYGKFKMASIFQNICMYVYSEPYPYKQSYDFIIIDSVWLWLWRSSPSPINLLIVTGRCTPARGDLTTLTI